MRALLLFAVACGSATAAPPPAVTITNLGPGRFALDATSAIKLKTVASLEVHRDGKWISVSDAFDVGKGYRLVATCGGTAADCVDLAAGGALVPVAWSGFDCSAQCNGTCRANAPQPAGDYRLVVTTCDGKTTFTGPAFHFDFDGTPFERAGLTDDVTAATVVRADLPAKGYDPAATAAADRIAGLVVRGTPQALDAKSRDALLALLRDRKGLAHDVDKRCKSDHHVGFALARPHGETVELTIDFACNRVFAAYGGGANGPRTVATAFFDGSRAAWLAFAKQVLPNDAELGKVR